MNIETLLRLLNDPKISEFMLNGYNQAFVEWEGALQSVVSPFKSSVQLDHLVNEMLQLQNTIASDKLSYDGILPDGSRFHVTLPPLSPLGPTLTIRKFSQQHRHLEDLTQSGFLTPKLATFLEVCVKGKMNILISGATGAGKTTLLNCLAGLIDPQERVITIEDIPELQLQTPNWVRMLAVRDPQCEVSVRDCVIGSLRMRPDRILVGECRSLEALEMLQAMNTGHSGGMTTIHANSTGDSLTRLESLILFHSGAEISLRSLRRQIVDALDLIVQIKRGSDGQRYIEEVMEVIGMEGDTITRSPIFKRPESASAGGKN
jgi:pilus assembly protein CpaF